ncbi:MAG: lysophospholipid acyltransferase family protein [Patescibacteria group bacterium]
MKKIFLLFLRFFVFPLVRRHLGRIEGENNIPNSNFILASNHINGKDHWFILYVLREKLKETHFIGALDTIPIFLQSWLLYYMSDTIIINRKKIDREGFIEKISSHLGRKENIVIYPEGGTNEGKALLKGKTGMAELALKTNTPVLPIGISRDKDNQKRIIKIGKPLRFNEIPRDKEYRLLLRGVTDKIMQEISILSGKPYPY